MGLPVEFGELIVRVNAALHAIVLAFPATERDSAGGRRRRALIRAPLP
ncbi:MAG: hypothetical protein R2991_14520 [Thermoanaerobaculia bacterium]